MRPTDVKYNYQTKIGGHFFDRNTMKFFGDTMRSYGCFKMDNNYILYRKPSAMVNVFGTWCYAGKEYFNAWLVRDDGGLDGIYGSELDRVYSKIR